MATTSATRRLAKEYQQIQIDPPEFAIAKPNEKNILEWHYVITGPPDTPYHNGQYYGVLNFPPDYPFKPPSIKMVTPSGRFQCNTRLCLSISDFHPKSWNPSWQVSTILTGLVSFMTSEEMTTGGISTPNGARIGYARDSRKNNNENRTFAREFPDLVEENKKQITAGLTGLNFGQSGPATTRREEGTTARDKAAADRPANVQRRCIQGVVVVFVLAMIVALITDA